jgi:hypothetical protein
MKTETHNGQSLGAMPCSHDAIQQAWNDYHGPIHTDEGDGYVPSMPPTFMRGFVDGFQHAERRMREALHGHTDSELWGEHGLIAATMRCVFCGNSHPLFDWTSTEIHGPLPHGVYQCPSCNAAFRRQWNPKKKPWEAGVECVPVEGRL